MQIHVMPFGRPAWERRREILRGIISARPGAVHDYRGALYLVPNERLARTLRALFLDVLKEETGARACIPPAFYTLNRLLERRARQGKSVLEGHARAIVIGELIRKSHPQFAAQGLVRPVLDALDMLYAYGVSEKALREHARDSMPLGLLRDVKKGYESWLLRHGLHDLSALRAAYRPRPDDLPYESVVLDGFYDADPAELRLMKALASRGRCSFIVEAPGVSRPEAGAEGMPYRGTKELIDALTGGGQGLACPGAAEAEAALFCRALFEARPMRETYEEAGAAGAARVISINGAAGPAEEVYAIARRIKESFIKGETESVDRVLVFFPSPERHLPILKEAFDDYGIPYHVSQGEPLIESPVTGALMALLAAPLAGYSHRAMRRVCSSPFMARAEDGAWARLLRERLSGRKGVPAWADATLTLLDASGISAGVRGLARPGLTAAHDALRSEVEELKRCTAVLTARFGLGEYVSFLSGALGERRLKEPGGAVSGVRVLGRLEALTEPFDTVYAAGLSDGTLPSRDEVGIFFSEGAVRGLGLQGAFRDASRDARLFLGLILCAKRVDLFYPESGRRGPLLPSPYIRALEPFVRAGALARDTGITRPVEPEEALGPDELSRMLALTASKTPGEVCGEACAPTAETGRPAGLDRKRFSVTELEEYRTCRYRYYLARVVKKEPAREPDDDILPGKAGSIVHEILREFYDRVGRVGRDDAVESLRALREIAAKNFSGLPETLRNKAVKRRFMEELAPLFIEAEAELTGGYRVSATEQPVEMKLKDRELGHITLTGKIDRVEMDGEGNFVIVDYKTGAYPGAGKGPGGQFQLLLYAHMLMRQYAEVRPGARPAGFVYYDLKKGSMRDVVCYDARLYKGRAKDSDARAKTGEEVEEMVRKSAQDAREAVRGILAGEFGRDCKETVICRSCGYADLCGKEMPGAGGGEGDEGGDGDKG